MKLYYFGLKGRAEAVRLMMKLGGKDFEDITFSGEEWGAKYKAMSPSGQVRSQPPQDVLLPITAPSTLDNLSLIHI